MPKPKAPIPEIEYEESEPLDFKVLEEAFNVVFDKYFTAKGQSP